MAVSQFNGQAADGFANHGQVMQDRCEQDFVFEKLILGCRGNNCLDLAARG